MNQKDKWGDKSDIRGQNQSGNDQDQSGTGTPGDQSKNQEKNREYDSEKDDDKSGSGTGSGTGSPGTSSRQ